MNFQPIEAEDKVIIDEYFRRADSRHCDMSFTSVYLWKIYYPATYTIYDDLMIFKGEGEDVTFSFPIGDKDPKVALQAIFDYCKENDIPPAFHCLTRENEAYLEAHYPGMFTFEFDPGDSEYIYECEKLIRLSGKKYHGKKNHVNKFQKTYQWSYEDMDDSNRDDCIAMLKDWKVDNEDPEDDEKGAEVCACYRAIVEQKMLGLMGGLIRADGKVVAFTLAEKINSDTIDIHFEKAYSDVPGAYAMINQQFLIHHGQDVRYVNREEDMGDPGLRKAKESYHPAFLEENGYAYLKEEQ